MMFAILPLIPVAVWGWSAAISIAGGAVAWWACSGAGKATTPQIAYQNYEKSVFKADYTLYRDSVRSPMEKNAFDVRAKKLKERYERDGITPPRGEMGTLWKPSKDAKEAVLPATSPWTGKEVSYRITQFGEVWKIEKED